MNDGSSSLLEENQLSRNSQSPDSREIPNSTFSLREKKLRYHHKQLRRLDDIISRLDELFFIELFAVYLLDNFSLSLLFRGLLHLFYLTPRPKLFPQPRKEAPYLSAVFGSNLFCVFRHIRYPLPEGSEINRGYLHGNLLIDFVGQRAPTSKTCLILFDLALLALQLLLLAARAKRSCLEQYLAAEGSHGAIVRRPVEILSHETELASSAHQTSTQTYDAEERGVQMHEELEVAEIQNNAQIGTETFNDNIYRTWLSELDSGEAIVANLCLSNVFYG